MLAVVQLYPAHSQALPAGQNIFWSLFLWNCQKSKLVMQLSENMPGEFISMELPQRESILEWHCVTHAPFVHAPWSGAAHGRGAEIIERTIGTDKEGTEVDRESARQLLGVSEKMFIRRCSSFFLAWWSADLKLHALPSWW